MATRFAVAIFPPADALQSAVLILPDSANKWRSPYGSEAPTAVSGSLRMLPISRSAAVQILRLSSPWGAF